MSKSSTASGSKQPPSLSTKSAWARGPPTSASSPRTATPTSARPSSPRPVPGTARTQSPASSNAPLPSTGTHSRRPSTLSQGVSIKDGVAVNPAARGNVPAKQAPSVTFGSIDDASAPISSSPAQQPAPIKAQGGVKKFGSVTVDTPPSQQLQQQPNGKPAPPTPSTSTSTASNTAAASSAAAGASATPQTPSTPHKPVINKADIAKLFQKPSTSAPTPSSSTPPASDSATRSPAQPPQQLPPSASNLGQPAASPSPLGAHGYTTFVPSAGFRPPPQQNGANGVPGQPPRSPVYPRQMSNGQRPPGPNGPPTPSSVNASLPSPRMTTPHPHPHPAPTPGLPPQTPQTMVPGWPGYYYQPYGGMPPPEHYMNPYGAPAPWQMQSPMHPPQHLPPPHHAPPQGMPGAQHGGMPMSPRNPAAHLHTPGTPTQAHAVPSPSPSSSSGPSINAPPTPGGPAGRLNSNANAFVPGGRPASKIVIKDELGRELDVGELRKAPSASPAVVLGHGTRESRKSVVRMETPEAKREREERERLEREKKEREKREEEERKEKAKREEEERKKEAERKVKEEAERKAREEEERKKREEEERLRKEEEEKERIRKEEEEKERIRKEEEERKKREEEERIKREEEERLAKEAEEKERIRKVEEEKRKQEEAERLKKAEEEKAAAAAAAAASSSSEKEEGEVEESPEAKAAAKEKLRIDTQVASPTASEHLPKRRPGPLDLSSAQKQNISQPLPSALATARIIEDITAISYPDGIKSPKVELNVNAKNGKFRYDRDFLLQFMSVCKEKPDMLPPLDAIGLEPADQTHNMYRGGSGRRSSAAMPPPQMSRQASVGLGIGGFSKGGSGFAMGNFSTPGSKLSSQERFEQSRSVSATARFPGSAPMTRTPSQGGSSSGRTRSKKGTRRDDGKMQTPTNAFGPGFPVIGPNGQPLEPVAPLEKSENAWKPQSTAKRPAPVNPDSPEVVDRKVKALLNKLTMEKFDSISDQIIEWANRSEKEKDGRTLIQVIRLVFEKATDEAAWSEMYARLCRKMMERISPKVQDESIRSDDKPIAGGQLFRKYLLNRCQEDFERGWAAKDAAAAAAAAKAGDDEAARAEAEKAADGETALYSDEYYAAQKAKRRGLGLVQFIGELFKLQMLTERIMHECVKKLLANVDNPEEEEIESLCKLLTTVGKQLDSPKARSHMDIYFARMKELAKNPKVNSRMQFMLQDLIELRERNWIPRNQMATPSTIAQIRQNAAHEQSQDYSRLSMSRGGSRRGGDRTDVPQVGPDGWSVAGGASSTRPPPKAGDLSQFGKINKPAQQMTFGPSSVFAGKDKKRESISRTSSTSNMFSMLSQNPEAAAEAAAPKAARGPSRKQSVDLNAPTDSSQGRRKLQLLPRSKPLEDSGSTPAQSEPPSEDEEEPAANEMSEADANKKIDEDVKEFFGIRNIDEAEDYFTRLPAQHHFRLVDKLVTKAIESKEADAQLVGDLFKRAAEKKLCSSETFEEGFMPTAEILDDVAIDAPKAFDLMAIMMKGSGMSSDQCARLAEKSMDKDKLLGLLS